MGRRDHTTEHQDTKIKVSSSSLCDPLCTPFLLSLWPPTERLWYVFIDRSLSQLNKDVGDVQLILIVEVKARARRLS